MLNHPQIIRIASAVAKAKLGPKTIVRVMSETTADSEGGDALSITIVIKPGTVEKISGDAALNTLMGIHDELQKAGEERFPIVRYATEDELAGVDDQS